MSKRATIALAVAVAILLLTFALVPKEWLASLTRGGRGVAGGAPAGGDAATFVGRQACIACHQQQVELWQGSHHDLAMQVADESTVLGDFDDTTFDHFDVTTTFSRRGDRFVVRTEGPDGELHDYEIAFVFGVEPLQQYLVEFPGGRYQPLSIAWDTRPSEEGGQRWFHLYPDERIAVDDPLHWTGLNQNWNFMCAECHSTDLQKNYRFDEDAYETSWSEIDVSCEACHGPASNHVAWAEARESSGDTSRAADQRLNAEEMGLLVALKDHDDAEWNIDRETGVATRTPPRRSRDEIEACARCHARRSVVRTDYTYGRPLSHTHRAALLDRELYHADGQILDEVYVYGSFLQSRMYRQGVTCSDCHEPHSLRLLNQSNALCNRCHLAEKFDSPEHHFHEPASEAARCITCHMPARTYMVVDPRRDHSFRIPRPDLTVKLGTPNACSGCHTDRPAQWAADAVNEWYGPDRKMDPHYGEALHAGRNRLAGAEEQLVRLVQDSSMPGIARASALVLLRAYASQESVPAIQAALGNGDPMIRAAAVSALETVGPAGRLQMVAPMLRDRVRIVRLEAARVLAPVSRDAMSPAQRAAIDRSLEDFRDAQHANVDRPIGWLNLGWLHGQLGEFEEAEAAYQNALRLDPSFLAVYINLSDLYRIQGRDDEGERVLRQALEISRDYGDAHHALGLALVRQNRLWEALDELGRAAELRPEVPRYAYVFGVALQSAGEEERAIAVLEEAHGRWPGDRDLLIALVSIHRDAGRIDAAIEYARKLTELAPEDADARQLLQQLQAQR